VETMNTLKSLVPSWLHREDDEGIGEMPPPPVTAVLAKQGFNVGSPGGGTAYPTGTGTERPPQYSQADHERDILAKAAVIHDQLMRDRADAEKRIADLQIQLTEALLSRQGDGKKTEILELENAQLRNDLQSMQVDLNELRRFMSLVKQVLDKFGIKPPEKRPRKVKATPAGIETPHDPLAKTPPDETRGGA